MFSILEQLRPIVGESPVDIKEKRRLAKTIRAAVIAELRARPLQTSRELADRLDMDRHSISAELSRMIAESRIVREIDDQRRFRYRLSRGPEDRDQAQPVLLADKILEKMSDGQEWDTPSLRMALDFPPTRSISTAIQKMLIDRSIELVRTVSRGSAHRNVYRKVVK